MHLRSQRAVATVLIAALAVSCSKPAEKKAEPQGRGGAFPTSVEKVADVKPVVDKDAVDALQRMSNFLMTAKLFLVRKG